MDEAIAAVVGVGATPYSRASEATPLEMAATALQAALADADMEAADLDGLVVNVGSPRGVDYDVLCDRLGISAAYTLQTWSHGRFAMSCLQTAAMAVRSGLARSVAVLRVSKSSKRLQYGGAADLEGSREGGGPHGELPHYGLTAPASGAAMAARLYMLRYDVDEDALGPVAATIRDHATRNPRAIFQEPFDLDAYRMSPMLIDPLRRLDFSIAADGAICLLVQAPSGEQVTSRSLLLTGMQGVQAGSEEFVFARPGLGMAQQRRSPFAPSRADGRAFSIAGIAAENIDAFYTYDAFSPLVWFALERFGFCGEGEAAAFCEGDGLAIGGRLPTNTNGGLLSEGHLSGFNHLVEIAAQLRGEGGDRQVRGIRRAMWGSCFGDALVFEAA